MVNEEAIIQEKIKNPDALLKEIAQKYGIPYGTVSKILKKHQISTKRPVLFPKLKFICNNCRKEYTITNPRKNLFCSGKCKTEYNQITIACDACGKPFIKDYGSVQYRILTAKEAHFFCSAECEARYKGHKLRDYS